jgi:hypothetical protein
MAHLHLWHQPIVFYWDCCTLLEWELSWGTKYILRVFAESVGKTLNYSQQSYSKLVVYPTEYPLDHYLFHSKPQTSPN